MEACKLDQETAKVLLVEGGTLVFLGVPPGTQFGVDMRCWSTDDRFRGVKMIPPGLHYVHYAAGSAATGDFAPRSGFMYYFKKREFVVKMWDKVSEDVSPEEASEESVQRLRDNLQSLDRHLAPYPYEIWPKWKQLTSHITAEIAERLSPESGIIRASVELMSTSDAERPRGVKGGAAAVAAPPTPGEPEQSAVGHPDTKRARRITREEKEEAMLPALKPVPGAALRLTRIPARAPPGCSPQELTRHHLDQTYALERMMARHERPLDIIGELQFAYLCFLIGHSLEAFEHWRDLVVVLCSCDEALRTHGAVYLQLARALPAQLEEMPPEFLADIVTSRNVVHAALRRLLRTARLSRSAPGTDARVLAALERLAARLAASLQWDLAGLDDDEEDERPVLVPLPYECDAGGGDSYGGDERGHGGDLHTYDHLA